MDTSMDNRRVCILQLGVLTLNVVSVMGLSIFIYATTESMQRSYVVREFLSDIQAVVWYPYWDIWLYALLLALLTGSMFVWDRLFPDNSKVILFSLVADFAICFTIIILLGFNYNGILLLMPSNAVFYAKSKKSKYFLVAVAIGSPILINYKLLSISYRLYPIQDYISFYSVTTQQYLLSSYSVLVSLSIIMFVVHCVNIINQQQGDLGETHALNEQLQDVNEQLQEYSVITEKMAETRERSCLAREIHDALGRTLTGTATGIGVCLAIIGTSPQQTKDQLELISRVTRGGIKRIRRSVSQLRPDALERFSLEYAISKMVSDMNVVSGVRVYFGCQVKNLKLDEDGESAIYGVI